MKYIIFSVMIIVATYIITTVIAKLKKMHNFSSSDTLSQSVSTACKGIAICIIMLSHLGDTFGVRYFTPLGSWGVGIFLFLSGYGLEMSTKNYGFTGFWKKRLLSAWLPYALAEGIGLLFCVTSQYSQSQIQDVVLDLLLIRPIHPFGWYMQCLFLYYLGFYLAHRLFGKIKVGKYTVLIAFSAIFFVFFRSLFKQQIFTFVFGVLLADSTKIRERITQKPLSAVLLLIFGIVILAVRQLSFVRNLPLLYELIFSLQVLCLSLGTVSAVGQLSVALPTVLFEAPVLLGIVSYEIYLYHGWVLSWVSKLPVSYLRTTLSFSISIVIAIVAYVLRKKLFVWFRRKFTQTA